MVNFRLTHGQGIGISTFLPSFGPSQFARFDSDGPGGDFDGGHGVSTASWLYSFNEIIEPAVAASHPSWSQEEIHTHALRIFNIRIAENARSFRDEEKNTEGMDTLWEVAERDGVRQLIVKEGPYKGTSLNEFWEHTRQFAQNENSPQAYNIHEHRAQLAMQEALIEGRAKSAASVLSHPEDIKYVQVWETQADGTIITRQIDLKNATGRHLSHEEGRSLVEKLAQKYAKQEQQEKKPSEYVHVITQEKIGIQEVQIMAKAHVAVSPAQLRGEHNQIHQMERDRVFESHNRLPHVDERLGEATYDTLSFVTRRVISDGFLAFDQIKRMAEHKRTKKIQEESDRVKIKKLRAYLGIEDGEIKKESTLRAGMKQKRLETKNEREKRTISKAFHVGVRVITALTLVRHGVTGALPVVAIGLVVNEVKFIGRIKKEKRNMKQINKSFSEGKKNTEIFVQKKNRKKRDTAQSLHSKIPPEEKNIQLKKKEKTSGKDTVKRSKKQKRLVFAIQTLFRRLQKEHISLGKKFTKRIERKVPLRDEAKQGTGEARVIQKTEYRKKELQVQKKKETIMVIHVSLALAFWMLLFVDAQQQQKANIDTKKKEKDHIYADKAEKISPFLLLSIIYYLAMIRESGASQPVQPKKARKKKNKKFHTVMPQSGIIFACSS